MNMTQKIVKKQEILDGFNFRRAIKEFDSTKKSQRMTLM